jgi:hypothetical protein
LCAYICIAKALIFLRNKKILNQSGRLSIQIFFVQNCLHDKFVLLSGWDWYYFLWC